MLMIVIERVWDDPSRTMVASDWRPQTRWTFCSAACLEATILFRCMQMFPDDYRMSYALRPADGSMCYCK